VLPRLKRFREECFIQPRKILEKLNLLSKIAEVLIYDNQSKNNWGALSKKYSFIKKNMLLKKITDFSSARNRALREAKNDWVFFIDSDEILEPFDGKKLAAELTRDTAALTIVRNDIFINKKIKYGEAGSQEIIRLMKKKSALFKNKIHEIAKVSGKVKKSSLKIKHFSHTSIDEFIDDISFYTLEIAKNIQLSRIQLLAQILFFPGLKFFYTYFILGGFLDGYRGITYAYIMSLHSLMVRVHYYEQHAQKK